MPRVRTTHVCTECGGEAARWMGRCPHCQAWNTLVEQTVRAGGIDHGAKAEAGSRPVSLVEVATAERPRWPSGLDEFDFVLGGGIVPGSLILLGGDPGIGKSTLLLQVSGRLAAAGREVLYVSGEESSYQLKLRVERLREPTDSVQVLSETAAETIIDRVRDLAPDVLIVDSIQTLYTGRLNSAPGSVAQVREVASELQRLAKTREMATFLVGHVTKGGGIAGPKTLEHIVDVVLYFEWPGTLDHRIVRGTKNRFGAADEIALFRMSASGLEPLQDPSALFLQDRQRRSSGSAVAATLEGTRPLLVEVQALASSSVYGSPQRVATGFDSRRLALLLAVLERRGGLTTSGFDIFVNVVGGLTLSEPAADLAVTMAVASAIRDRALDPDAVFVGEVGLGGEIRSVGQIERRLGEVGRQGFKRAYIAESSALGESSSVEPVAVADLAQLMDAIFE